MDQPGSNSTALSRRAALLSAAVMALPAASISRVGAKPAFPFRDHVHDLIERPGPKLDDPEVDAAIAAYEQAQAACQAISDEVERIDAQRPAGLKLSEAPECEATSADDFVAQRETHAVFAARCAAATARYEAAKAEHAAHVNAWEAASGYDAVCQRCDEACDRLSAAEAAIYVARPRTLQGLHRKLVVLAGFDGGRDPGEDRSNPDWCAQKCNWLLADDVRRLLTAGAS